MQVMRSLLPPPQRQSREVSGLERRKTRRVSRAFPVHYTLHIPHQDEPEELIGKGKTIDIGPGGLMLKTALPLQPTHVLNLAVELGRDTPPIQVEGTVQWVKPEQAFTQQVGVRFTRMEEEARTRLVNALFGAFQQG
ncbi:MAG: PilZ domain-containing protein [Nitrospinota bacterium]|nr:MAG: PilZ domain-containing protein [Nitrospinota bacterium]